MTLFFKNGIIMIQMNNFRQYTLFACLGNDKMLDLILMDEDSEDSYAEQKFKEAILLHYTVQIQKHTNEKVIELLLSNGANINQMDYDEMSLYGLVNSFGK